MKSFTKGKRQQVYNKFNGKCAYCGCDISLDNFTVDHIIPRLWAWKQSYLQIAGRNEIKGTNDISNLNPSCRKCNVEKHRLSINDYKIKSGVKIFYYETFKK